MKLSDLFVAAQRQQALTGNPKAGVAFVIPGKWPPSGKKRLLGRRGGPYGACQAEYEDAVLCVFEADAVVEFLTRLLNPPHKGA